MRKLVFLLLVSVFLVSCNVTGEMEKKELATESDSRSVSGPCRWLQHSYVEYSSPEVSIISSGHHMPGCFMDLCDEICHTTSITKTVMIRCEACYKVSTRTLSRHTIHSRCGR